MSAESKIRVVGIGAAGIRMLEKVCALKLPNVLTIGVDTDVNCITNARVEKKLPLKIAKAVGGTGGDTNLAKEAATQYLQYLLKITRGANVIVLLGGLGGGTASMIAPILTKLVEKQTLVISIFAMPMEFEGETKIKLAEKSFAFLQKKSTTAIALKNDMLLSGESGGVEDAFNLANEKIAMVVENLSAGFSEKAFLKIDTGVLRSFAEKEISVGVAQSPLSDISDAFAEIKRSPMMKENLKLGNMLVALKCPKNFSIDDIKLILKTAKSELLVDDKMFFSVAPDASTECVKILTIATNATLKAEVVMPSMIDEPEAPRTPEPLPIQKNEAIAETQPKEELITSEPEEVIKDDSKTFVEESDAPQTKAPVEYKQEKKSTEKQEEKEQMTLKFDERGLFENTPPNERKGVDIDSPTFARKNINIKTL